MWYHSNLNTSDKSHYVKTIASIIWFYKSSSNDTILLLNWPIDLEHFTYFGKSFQILGPVLRRLRIKKINANTVNTCLLCEILRISIGNMLNSMKESPSFYPFSCVSHLEWNGDMTFPSYGFFPTWIIQRCNISYIGIRRVQINSQRKKWIGCYYRPTGYVYGARFTGEYLYHRTESNNKVKDRYTLLHVITYATCRTDTDSCY